MRTHQYFILLLAGVAFKFVNWHNFPKSYWLILNPSFAWNEFPASGLGLAGGDGNAQKQNQQTKKHLHQRSSRAFGFVTGRMTDSIQHDIHLLQYCQNDKRVITLVGEMGGSSQSLKGQLLLDGGMLTGSFFHRTVVFVCQHNDEGAFGLILNRRMEHTIQELSTEIVPEKLEKTPIYVGGPVQPGALSFLITDSYLDDEEIIPNVAMGHSFDRLVELCNNYSPQRDIRIYSGYSGWSPGQLEAEIKRGSWTIHPANKKLVFDHEPGDLWRHIMYQKGWEERLFADSPDDLSDN